MRLNYCKRMQCPRSACSIFDLSISGIISSLSQDILRAGEILVIQISYSGMVTEVSHANLVRGGGIYAKLTVFVGYYGRLCSQCAKGYFASGRQCAPCENYFKWILPIMYLNLRSSITILITRGYVFAVVTLSVYGWQVSPGDSAALKIVFFHFQSLVVVVMGGMEWELQIDRFLSTSSNASYFSVYAIECLIPGWHVVKDGLLFLIFLPLILCLLVRSIIYALNS